MITKLPTGFKTPAVVYTSARCSVERTWNLKWWVYVLALLPWIFCIIPCNYDFMMAKCDCFGIDINLTEPVRIVQLNVDLVGCCKIHFISENPAVITTVPKHDYTFVRYTDLDNVVSILSFGCLFFSSSNYDNNFLSNLLTCTHE